MGILVISVLSNMERLKELFENEKKYINNLKKAKKYAEYMEESKTNENLVQMTEDLKTGKYQFVFSNVDELLKFHQE